MNLDIWAVLVIIGGWLAGRLFCRLKLPSIVGMLCFGILAGYYVKSKIPPVMPDLEPFLKSLALIVILLRAGLGLKWENLKKIGLTAILMSFVPCLFEGFALTVIIRLVLGFPWLTAGLAGFMLASVSLAVVVPSMLEIKENAHESSRKTATLILAGTSADNVTAVTFFTIALNIILSGKGNLSEILISIPVSVLGGVLGGVLLGHLLAYFFSAHYKNIRATEKALILMGLGLVFVRLGDFLHISSLLGIMTVGLILLEKANVVANELAAKLAKIWVLAEIYLFVLIGVSVDVPTAMNMGLKGIAIIILGLVFRSAGVYISTAFSDLTAKERLFCVIAYLPKATVQAALGGIPLAFGIPGGKEILSLAALAILFTSPLGLMGINYFKGRLLNCPDENAASMPCA